MSRLAETPILIATGLAMLLIGASFGLVQPALGGTLLDMVITPEAAAALLASMSPAEKTVHLWTTLLLDTAYPLAYGAFFIGLIWRLGGRRLAFLPYAGMVADFLENSAQAAALAGWPDLLGAKIVLTPVKFALLGATLLVILVLIVRAILRRFG